MKVETKFILTNAQADFLKIAIPYWEQYDGAHELKRSMRVATAVLGSCSYNEKQKVYLTNVREWYIKNFEPNIEVGDIVRIKKKDMDSLGEQHVFTQALYTVDEISNKFVRQLSGNKCTLAFTRFTIIKKKK